MSKYERLPTAPPPYPEASAPYPPQAQQPYPGQQPYPSQQPYSSQQAYPGLPSQQTPYPPPTAQPIYPPTAPSGYHHGHHGPVTHQPSYQQYDQPCTHQPNQTTVYVVEQDRDRSGETAAAECCALATLCWCCLFCCEF